MTIEAVGLSKTYGSVLAVDSLSFTVPQGVVTGFLGPNGAGKSTAMRLMLGLDSGAGRTVFDGRPLREHRHASRVVGAHLDAKVFHPQRTARNHLRMLACDSGASNARVDEVLSMVGLDSVARKRPKTFSLGMAQRLALAGAVLADPVSLMLDEPANGLDPQSIQWLREFLRHYAAQGRSVLVSSHLLSEMQLMADRIVVIAKGKLVTEGTVEDFVSMSTRNDVLVRCDRPEVLADLLRSEGTESVAEGPDGLSVSGESTERIGEAAFRAGVVVRELVSRRASLEQAFLELTSDAQEFAAGGQS